MILYQMEIQHTIKQTLKDLQAQDKEVVVTQLKMKHIIQLEQLTTTNNK